MTDTPWPQLDYWKSKEWLDVQDKLDDLEKLEIMVNPHRDNLFRSLQLTSFEACRVFFAGQDPYTDPEFATGVAFSSIRQSDLVLKAKGHCHRIPASLKNILIEYDKDLGYGFPKSGCLEPWCTQGVLLWNVIPTSLAWRMPKSAAWPEWASLTQEIIERLSAKGKIIFVFCGAEARHYAEFVDNLYNTVLYFSHPSPRGQWNAKSRFIGSRIFSTINAHLINKCQEPIDWKLD